MGEGWTIVFEFLCIDCACLGLVACASRNDAIGKADIMPTNEGQHLSTQDLLVANAREVILGILRHLDSGVCTNVDVDYVRYRLEWLIAVISRFGKSYENEAAIIHCLQSALSSLAS